jgi:hypothetical protein
MLLSDILARAGGRASTAVTEALCLAAGDYGEEKAHREQTSRSPVENRSLIALSPGHLRWIRLDVMFGISAARQPQRQPQASSAGPDTVSI